MTKASNRQLVGAPMAAELPLPAYNAMPMSARIAGRRKSENVEDRRLKGIALLRYRIAKMIRADEKWETTAPNKDIVY